MSHLFRSLLRVKELLESKPKDSTLHHLLNDHFRLHREMGSRDRRFFRTAAYSYCRLGTALQKHSFVERMAVASFLTDGVMLEALPDIAKSTMLEGVNRPAELSHRIDLVREKYPDFLLEDLFPLWQHVSSGIDRDSFVRSMLVQPAVWIRVRESYAVELSGQLKESGISYSVHPDHPFSWSLPQGTRLESLGAKYQQAFEVQDLASQLVCACYDPKPGESWWDLCAASGGKSIALLDDCPQISLLASDVRPAILKNLQERMVRSGHEQGVEVSVLDASDPKLLLGREFDAIIADVPCSGSGTWSRTPEQLIWFEDGMLSEKFQPLQKAIVSTAARHIKPGGKIFYSTCSVFEEENEQLVNWAVKTLGLKLVHNSYISRYFDSADTLFLAVLAS